MRIMYFNQGIIQFISLPSGFEVSKYGDYDERVSIENKKDGYAYTLLTNRWPNSKTAINRFNVS